MCLLIYTHTYPYKYIYIYIYIHIHQYVFVKGNDTGRRGSEVKKHCKKKR